VVNGNIQSLGHAGQTFGFQSYMGVLQNGSNFAFGIDSSSEIWSLAIILPVIMSNYKRNIFYPFFGYPINFNLKTPLYFQLLFCMFVHNYYVDVLVFCITNSCCFFVQIISFQPHNS